MCGCFGNMYTVLWLRFFLTWLKFFLPWLRFFRALSSVVRQNARVKHAKTGHGQHSFTLVIICVVRLLFVLFYVLFVCKCVLPPGDNLIAVNKYIISLFVLSKQVHFWQFLITSFLKDIFCLFLSALKQFFTSQSVRNNQYSIIE
jgi:hypothetical protein